MDVMYLDMNMLPPLPTALTWWPKQQDALGVPGEAAGGEQPRVLQGQLHHFPQGVLGCGQRTHIRKPRSGILRADDLHGEG